MNLQVRFLLVGLLALACFLPWSSASAQTVEYIHTDALGTPIAVTNASRVVIERSEYEPYGKLLNRPLTDGPGFTGHVQDAATGMTYMQQRYYDPIVGRFLSVDPVTANSSTGANFNRYWYANNNPYKFTDPDGRQSRDLEYEYKLSGARPPSSGATFSDFMQEAADFINPFMPIAECYRDGCGKGGWAMAGIAVLPQGKGTRILSAIKIDSLLVREAASAGKSVQASLDGLTAQLAKGNMNPGIGTKHLFNGVFEARARDGARVYFRKVEEGVEIVGKSSKDNQQKVIERLKDIYDK